MDAALPTFSAQLVLYLWRQLISSSFLYISTPAREIRPPNAKIMDIVRIRDAIRGILKNDGTSIASVKREREKKVRCHSKKFFSLPEWRKHR